jgi:Helix-turn-helix domain
MSNEALNWALKVRCVPSPARHVLLVMANSANGSAQSWLSVNTLRQITGLGERTIRRALEQLRSSGLIQVLTPARGTLSTHYSLALQGGHSGTPASQAPLPIRHPTPATQAARVVTQAATPACQAPNPKNEPIEPQSARASNPDGPRAPDQDQSPKSGTLSRADRLALLPPEIRSRLAPSPPGASSTSAALAEIEARRRQAAFIADHGRSPGKSDVSNIDTLHAARDTVAISAPSDPGKHAPAAAPATFSEGHVPQNGPLVSDDT